MMKFKRTFKGAGAIGKDGNREDVVEYLTVTAAQYANENTVPDAAVLTTLERGAMLISMADHPELWAQMLASRMQVEPCAPMQYGEKRAAEWSAQPVGDQLDAILAGFEAIAAAGVPLPQSTLDLLDFRKGVKERNKKP